jgi:hypothetical protein
VRQEQAQPGGLRLPVLRCVVACRPQRCRQHPTPRSRRLGRNQPSPHLPPPGKPRSLNRLFEVNRAGRCSWLFPVGIGGCMPSVCVVAG